MLASPEPPQSPSLELPELDKADDAEETDVGGFELNLGEELGGDDESDALDSFSVDIQEQTDPGSNEAASDLDVGGADLLDALPETPAAREGDDLPPAPSGDLDFSLETPMETDEPSTHAELGDDGLESLPELMTENDEGDDGPDLERPLLPGAPEGAIPRGPQSEVDWLVLGSSCSALALAGSDVLCCAERLMQFGAERHSFDLPGGTRVDSLVALDDGSRVLATARGVLEISSSGACTWPEIPELARGSGASVCQLVSAPGVEQLWARLSSGALLRRRAGNWARHEAGGSVRSLSSLASHITLLVVAGRPTLQLSDDGGSSFRELLLPEPAATVALAGAAMAVALGSVLALADAERGLCVSSNGGESFTMVTGAVNVTAIAVGASSLGPRVFAALYREAGDVTELISVQPETGQALSIAELASEPDDDAEETGRTSALIFADGSLWAAGSYGLARLKP